MALLNIPDPNKPPTPLNPYGGDDDTLRVLIITLDRLMKEVEELKSRLEALERK